MCDVLKAYGMSEAGHQSSGQSHFGATLVEVIIQQPTDYFFFWLYLLEHFPTQCNELLSLSYQPSTSEVFRYLIFAPC